MFNLFKNKTQAAIDSSQIQNFDYLTKNDYYFDSACQSLRPQQVINAEIEYYQQFNTCGHRVKYKWGQIVDKKVSECRANLLKLVGKNSKDYTVAFGLNTTHLISLVLHQINPKQLGLQKIITSEIEHNSVFLSSLTWANRNNLPRLVLERVDLQTQNNQKLNPGSLLYDQSDLEKAVVIVNTMSNIDGQELLNADILAKDVHQMGGILLLDACQTFGHNPEILENIDFDAVFGSGHKMYGPSVGFVIIKKDLLKKLDCYLIGGSTVQDVKKDSYELVQNDEEIYARIEPGLQNYAGIIGLNESIKWRENFVKDKQKEIQDQTNLKKTYPRLDQIDDFGLKFKNDWEQILASYLNQKLKEILNIKLLNSKPSAVVSLYSDKMDGHKMAMYLSEAGVMCRSGYHCCHYYLKEKKEYPPLFRISLGLHNTPKQIDYLIDKMKVILT